MYMREEFVNVDVINNLIEHLKTDRKHMFDMSSWDTCICGHLARMLGDRAVDFDSPILYGARKLGITEDTASELFAIRIGDRSKAIRCLEILRDEGVVAWDRVSA